MANLPWRFFFVWQFDSLEICHCIKKFGNLPWQKNLICQFGNLPWQKKLAMTYWHIDLCHSSSHAMSHSSLCIIIFVAQFVVYYYFSFDDFFGNGWQWLTLSTPTQNVVSRVDSGLSMHCIRLWRARCRHNILCRLICVMTVAMVAMRWLAWVFNVVMGLSTMPRLPLFHHAVLVLMFCDVMVAGCHVFYPCHDWLPPIGSVITASDHFNSGKSTKMNIKHNLLTSNNRSIQLSHDGTLITKGPAATSGQFQADQQNWIQTQMTDE